MAAIKEKIFDYLKAHKYCVLCCGAGDVVRATPVRYSTEDGCIIIYSEKFTRKFHFLKRNPGVALALHSQDHPLQGLQVWGAAEVIGSADPRHGRYLFQEAQKSEKLRQACRVLNLILVRPSRMVLLEQEPGRGYRYYLWQQDRRGRETERQVKTIRELSRIKK